MFGATNHQYQYHAALPLLPAPLLTKAGPRMSTPPFFTTKRIAFIK